MAKYFTNAFKSDIMHEVKEIKQFLTARDQLKQAARKLLVTATC